MTALDVSRYVVIQDADATIKRHCLHAVAEAFATLLLLLVVLYLPTQLWKRCCRTVGRLQSRRSTKIAAINDIALQLRPRITTTDRAVLLSFGALYCRPYIFPLPSHLSHSLVSVIGQRALCAPLLSVYTADRSMSISDHAESGLLPVENSRSHFC